MLQVNVKETRSYVHSMVHRGRTQHISNACAALGNGASTGLVIKVGDDEFHTTFSVAMSGNGRVILYEDPTLTSCTLCLTACSMNRQNKSVHPAASFGHTPVFAVAGASVLSNTVLAGGTGIGQSTIGGETRSNNEWVLAKDTTYILAACNLSGGAVFASISAEGYKY